MSTFFLYHSHLNASSTDANRNSCIAKHQYSAIISHLCAAISLVFCPSPNNPLTSPMLPPSLNQPFSSRCTPQRIHTSHITPAVCTAYIAPTTQPLVAPSAAVVLHLAQLANAFSTVGLALSSNLATPHSSAALAPSQRPGWKKHYIQARRWLGSRYVCGARVLVGG